MHCKQELRMAVRRECASAALLGVEQVVIERVLAPDDRLLLVGLGVGETSSSA